MRKAVIAFLTSLGLWSFFTDSWNPPPTSDTGCGFDPWGCPKGS